jgi:porphobilinogen synthase
MSEFPILRGRRLRRTPALRSIVRQAALSASDLILPAFVVEGERVRRPVSSMPGVEQTSVDQLIRDAEGALELGVPAVILFGIPDEKDEVGTAGYAEDGIIQRATRELKEEFPDLLVITDVCLCEYTSHGHCGVLRGSEIDNDASLPLLSRMAVSHAEAGADIVAPSDMMDGRVAAIRHALDESGYVQTPIMAYSAKYASTFYGPFREAAESQPSFGDRKSYQMDPGNSDEALREAWADIHEGADILMIKPGMPCLDIIYRVKQETGYPVCAYQVSGEYASIMAAGRAGWLDADAAILEATLAMRRAGADMIVTYSARRLASLLKQ